MTEDDRRTAAALMLIEAGWEIVACNCECGGRFAWAAPRPSGATMQYGCICHNDPMDIVKRRCSQFVFDDEVEEKTERNE